MPEKEGKKLTSSETNDTFRERVKSASKCMGEKLLDQTSCNAILCVTPTIRSDQAQYGFLIHFPSRDLGFEDVQTSGVVSPK
jgi:hypothetical protein